MLLALSNGIALATPENIIFQTAQDIAESASGSINLSVQKNIIGMYRTRSVCLLRKMALGFIQQKGNWSCRRGSAITE
ncbi:hypothetical protein F993_03558 [Acinetobacter proteolyticus]|uniref:Uncharacterized protein n=1 Tax=Acinetobacter proteolyticus TaxID=1776741 RepID=A0ABN0J912_9GAMM|nr:hypothetical protein F993_03558 [Acinetobacter proteolyticus]